jgi:hypothetical protein
MSLEQSVPLDASVQVTVFYPMHTNEQGTKNAIVLRNERSIEKAEKLCGRAHLKCTNITACDEMFSR